MKILYRIEENNKLKNEKIDSMKEEINENSRRQNEVLSETLMKQMNEKFDRSDESLKQMKENNRQTTEQLENKIDSINRRDVYKRQVYVSQNKHAKKKECSEVTHGPSASCRGFIP